MLDVLARGAVAAAVPGARGGTDGGGDRQLVVKATEMDGPSGCCSGEGVKGRRRLVTVDIAMVPARSLSAMPCRATGTTHLG